MVYCIFQKVPVFSYILNWFLFCLSAFKLFSVFRLDQVVSENLKQLGVQLPQKAYQCAVHYFKRSVQQRDLHQLVSAFIVNDILAVWISYCVCFLQTRGWIVYIYWEPWTSLLILIYLGCVV